MSVKFKETVSKNGTLWFEGLEHRHTDSFTVGDIIEILGRYPKDKKFVFNIMRYRHECYCSEFSLKDDDGVLVLEPR